MDHTATLSTTDTPPGGSFSQAPRAGIGSGALELLSRRAIPPRNPISLLFVHGINVGAWVWEEHFLDHFAGIGFDTHALSLRGHGGSWGAERLRDWTLSDYVDDVREAVRRIGGPVVLIGHSMGGAVIQKFVQRGGRAAGLALMASVPPWGLAPSAIRMATQSPRLFAALVALSSGRPPPRDAEMVRRMLFSAETTDAAIERFLARAGPESPQVAAELQGWPPFAPAPFLTPDVFVISGGVDTLVPNDEVWRTGLYYGRSAEIVPGLGHALMLEPRWRDVADRLERWLISCFPHAPPR